MALEQEPTPAALERGDSTLRFTATAGEENGPYRVSHFMLVRGDDRQQALGMSVDGKVLAVRFPSPLQDGDQVELPE